MTQRARQLLDTVYANPSFARRISLRLYFWSVSRRQGDYLVSLINSYRPKTVIECGYGFGISALWFLSAAHRPRRHYIIELSRKTRTDPIFSYVAKQPGVTFLDGISSQQFLAGFDVRKQTADFVFIDADERVDAVITDLYFSFRIISRRGHIVIRNLWNPSVRKAIACYLTNHAVGLPQFPPVEQRLICRLGAWGVRYAAWRLRKLDLLVMNRREPDKRPWNHFVHF